MRVFLLDWCPAGSSRGDLSVPASVDQPSSELLAEIQNLGLSHVDSDIGELVLVARNDGLYMFSFDVPDEFYPYDGRDLARKIAFRLKTGCLRHTHLHHREGDRGVGLHYPILFEAPPELVGLADEGEELIEALKAEMCALLLDDERLLRLKPMYWDLRVNQNSRALLKLDEFIARKYRDCVDFMIQNNKTRKNDFRFKIFGFLAIVGMSMLLSFSIHWYLVGVEDYAPNINYTVSYFLIGLFCGLVSVLFYMRKNYYRSSIHAINSYVGFLERAGDFSTALDRILRSTSVGSAGGLRGSTDGYKNMIASLLVMRADVERSVAVEERFFNGVLAVVGLTAAVVSISD